MGLSSLPTPSENILTLLLANAALSIQIFKRILLHPILRFGRSPPEPDNLTDRFRSSFKPVRFGRRTADRHAVDCRVCLASFETESVVNRLPCGHVFHRVCVEKWLDYHHATCPLCRTHLLPPSC